MNKTRKSRASLFLIELILAILFFSLGSAICVRIFAQAALISRSAADLSFASSQVSSAASVIRFSDDPAKCAEAFFPGACRDENSFSVFYDSDRTLCSEENAVYTMDVTYSISDGFGTGYICMTGAEGEVLYDLELSYPVEYNEEAP